MANKRNIKKDINSVLGNVLEECYSEMLNNPGVKEKEINSIIDDAVDLADNLISRVNHSKTIPAKEKKAHFKKINEELEEKAIDFIEKLNKLS
ncbi:MAG TPA: hypothetical protein VLB84_07275 [Bacteroidia bacterium]|jgi:hypothetical protein|nr:hypothetical protein [Bacteroidia bacterium]